jgi:O-antigen/teichoic acid export membrane protein
MTDLMIAVCKRLAFAFWGQISTKLGRASFWLIIGGIVCGVLGYVFQVLMGRMLSVQEFGLLSALMALLMIVGAPLNALIMLVSREVSTHRARQDYGSIFHFFYSSNLRTALIVLVFITVFLLSTGKVQVYLKTSESAAIYLLAVLFFFGPPQAINDAFLQGVQSFKWLSATGVLGRIIKTIGAVMLVWAGYGVAGVLGGMILSSVVVWWVTYRVLNHTLTIGRGRPYQLTPISFRSLLPVLLANTAFAVMTQLDMILVKYYFPPQEAGLYAAASILGKAVLYLPGGIVVALYPMTAENHARGESSVNLLVQAFVVAAALCTAGAFFYLVFGESVVTALYGERYQEAGVLLKYYGFAILPMALILVIEHFLIAKRRVLFAYLFLTVAPLQIGAIYWLHDSLLTVLAVIAVTGFTTLFVGTAFLWRGYRRQEPAG